MTPDETTALFTRSDESYLFARWGRPIAPIVFGVEDNTLSVLKGACEAICALAGHKMAETDPELGANLMVFFFRDWAELLEVPDLDRQAPTRQRHNGFSHGSSCSRRLKERALFRLALSSSRLYTARLRMMRGAGRNPRRKSG